VLYFSISRQQRRLNAIQTNIATNDHIQQKEKQEQSEKFSLTPPSKYPTDRGATADSRKIIATGAGRLHLTAVRLAHILFASVDIAEASLHELRKASISFEELKAGFEKKFGFPLPELQCQLLHNKMDIDNDGRITYEEFKSAMDVQAHK